MTLSKSSPAPGNPADSNAAVAALIRRFKRTDDFPAFSKTILEINQSLAKLRESSAADFAAMILKDFSLTNKLLKLVNSAYYGFVAGEVTTVTRAVVLLGYERIRTAAASLMLFEQLQSKNKVPDLQRAALNAYWRGLAAQDIARRIEQRGAEEAFICAMLHNLGRHLAIFYLPEQFGAVKELALSENLSEEQAARRVLGTTYEALGMAVAEEWNFPHKIVASMERLPAGPQALDDSTASPTRDLANFANELNILIRKTPPEQRKDSLAALLHRYRDLVAVSETEINEVLSATARTMRAHAAVFGIDLKGSFIPDRLEAVPAGEAQAPHAPPRSDTDAPAGQANPESPSRPRAAAAAITPRQPAPPASVDVILSGLQEISTTLLGKYEINDIALMILEIIYRAFGFHRVVFFFREGRQQKFGVRFGYGRRIEEILDRGIIISPESEADIFSQALAGTRDLWIADTADPAVARHIPAWHREAFRSAAFTLLPIALNEICLGAFYADRRQPGPVADDTGTRYLQMLRNQFILAIRGKS